MNKSVLLLGLLVAACGGDDGGGPQIINPDAPPGGGSGNVDAPAANCGVASSNTATFNMDNSFAESDGTGMEQTLFSGGPLNADATPDVIEVQLYAGIGTFSNGITAKSIEITGAESNFATCGACVLVFANLAQGTEIEQVETYFATSGTLNVTSVTTNLEWTLTNATLEKVTIDWGGTFQSTPVNDGCTTTISNATLNTPIEVAMPPALRASGNAAMLRARKSR